MAEESAPHPDPADDYHQSGPFERWFVMSRWLLAPFYVGVMLGERVLGQRSADALMAAPPLAILVAEGMSLVLLFAVGKLMERGVPRGS